MTLAGILTRSMGYPLDDPPVMVFAAIDACLYTCRAYSLAPIGSFEMTTSTTRDDDEGVRWEFVSE
jgi:hypothetical protein